MVDSALFFLTSSLFFLSLRRSNPLYSDLNQIKETLITINLEITPRGSKYREVLNPEITPRRSKYREAVICCKVP